MEPTHGQVIGTDREPLAKPGPTSKLNASLSGPRSLCFKHLNPDIDSNDLLLQFSKFGQILGYMVVTGPFGFGSVSFQTRDQALAAVNAMNGLLLGKEKLEVRMHDSTQPKQDNLAQPVGGHIVGQPRNSKPAKNQPSPRSMSQRERIRAAINKLESSRQDELTDLLMGLSKRELAMCLFNVKVLRAKIADAKDVLDCSDDEDKGTADPSAT